MRDNIIRPLIETDRESIEKYCQENNLQYVTDSTNLECEYSRNKIRIKVLPTLCEINQNAVGALSGFAVGVLQDIASGTFLGVNAFTRVLIGFCVGKFSDQVFKEQVFLPVFASLLVTTVNYFILALLMILLGYRFNLMGHMQYTLLPMLIYQLAFAYPVHHLAYELDKRYGKKA